MKNKVGLIVGIIFVLASLRYQLHKDYVPKRLPPSISPETAIFAFDLHEVMLMPNIPGMIKTFCYQLPIKSFFFLLTHPQTWYHLWKSNTVFEKALIDLAHYYPQTAPLLPLVRTITNCQCPTKESIALVQQLRAHGYKVYLLSNIEHDTLQELYKKLPFIDEIFDGKFTPAPTNNWSAKPHRLFYEHFHDYLAAQGQGDKKVIFVDNSRVNIKGAEAVGMYGILFTSPIALQTLLHSHQMI